MQTPLLCVLIARFKCSCRGRILHRAVSNGLIVLVLTRMWPAWAGGQNQRVEIPLTLDYNLLQSLVIHSAFTEPGQAATVFSAEEGCTMVVVSEPALSQHKDGELMRLEVQVDISAGKSLGDHCILPVSWSGIVVLYQEPAIDPQSWSLSFRTVDSRVLTADLRPATVAEILWQLMQSWVYPYLDRIRINLKPPVDEMKTFLLPMFAEAHRRDAQYLLDGLTAASVTVTAVGLRVEMETIAPPVAAPAGDEPLQPLTAGELDEFTRLWEVWDVLLVRMITALTGQDLNDEERQDMLDLLLDTRYQFSEGLTATTFKSDFVREQFVKAWRGLAPLFRRHLKHYNEQQAWGYLSFFTAADALVALDVIGPALGLEISRNGLIRLARNLGAEEKPELFYTGDVDENLLEVLGIERMPDAEPPENNGPQSKLSRNGSGLLARIGLKYALSVVLARAVAMEGVVGPAHNPPRRWVLSQNRRDTYLKRVRAMVTDMAVDTRRGNRFPNQIDRMLETLILAVAWQESCFRQFHEVKGKVVYLRSYNGTSVGIMQVNERVWRGIYDLDQLRWDIHYNARCGGAIIARYINRYVLKQAGRIAGFDDKTIAGVVYAMYNGGPAQFQIYLKRLTRGNLYKSDRLFNEKYQWVVAGNWQMIERCLGSGHRL